MTHRVRSHPSAKERATTRLDSGDEFEDFSPLSERETSAQSPDSDVESYAEGSEEVEGRTK